MSRNSVRRAALGLLFSVLLGIAMPVPAFVWSGNNTASFFSVVWEWLQDLWPAGPAPTACTENCGDTGYGADPNG